MEETLDKIAAIAKKNNIKAYVVGGAVRDSLLGRKDFGVDITVEGDGMAFGKMLQKEFGGLLCQHSKFKTASLTFTTLCSSKPFALCHSEPFICHSERSEESQHTIHDKSREESLSNKKTIDIASCRKEKYLGIAELPEVGICHGVSLQEDLKRRDFTINTIVLDIEAKKIIDLLDGRKDLDSKLIRVLHPKSFVDDPTRIFRALRFAGKLGFELEPVTKSLALDAIKKGLIKKLSPKRIRDQIVLILKEYERQKILELMHQFGVLTQLGLKLPEDKLFKSIDKNLKLAIRPSDHQWFVYLLGIINFENPSEFIVFTRLELQKIERLHKLETSITSLETIKKPSEVYKLLNNLSNEELLFIASAYPKLKSKILKFLKVYQKVKLNISGKDLKQLGIKKGPLYKELLSVVLYAKLDGKLQSRKEELEFIKKEVL